MVNVPYHCRDSSRPFHLDAITPLPTALAILWEQAPHEGTQET
jgi:hypothetical protein